MPAKITLPQPLSQVFADPSKLQGAIDLLNALANLEVVLSSSASNVPLVRGERQIQGEPPNLILALPIQCATPIADSTATAGSVSTQLNLLLAQLRTTGILPR